MQMRLWESSIFKVCKNAERFLKKIRWLLK